MIGRARRGPPPRVGLSHPARVAAVTAAVIGVLYLVVGTTVDVVVDSRLTSEVDARLTAVLPQTAGTRVGLPDLGEGGVLRPRDLDDAPLLRWSVDPAGRASALTVGAPALPNRAWNPSPLTLTMAGIDFRAEARPEGSGWIVAAQSLAQPHHIRSVLLLVEAALAPVLLLATYLGAWAIGRRAIAPIERSRRRQLEFTADASHELRTPLSVIEAEVGLALGSPRSATYYRDSLQRVSEEGRRLRRIVEDLLWLARFDSEPPPPSDEPVDLGQAAAACVARFQPVAAARRIELDHWTNTTAALVEAPPEWVDRLLGVLVDNACRYAPEGGHVAIIVSTAGHRATVAVEDDGPGIPEDERDELFDRFRRATDQPGGAGLGLAIADSVVSETGGRWRVDTSGLGGARLEVSWPRASLPEVDRHRSQVRADPAQQHDTEDGADSEAHQEQGAPQMPTPP